MLGILADPLKKEQLELLLKQFAEFMQMNSDDKDKKDGPPDRKSQARPDPKLDGLYRFLIKGEDLSTDQSFLLLEGADYQPGEIFDEENANALNRIFSDFSDLPWEKVKAGDSITFEQASQINELLHHERGFISNHIKGPSGEIRAQIKKFINKLANQYKQPEHPLSKKTSSDKDLRLAHNFASVLFKHGKISQFKEMVKRSRLDLEKFELNGEPALIFAARTRDLEMMEFLIEHGAKIDSQDKNGQTALHIMAKNAPSEEDVSLEDKVLQGLKFLLRNGANPNIIDQDGNLALFYTFKADMYEFMKVLSDKTTIDSNGYEIHIVSDNLLDGNEENRRDICDILLAAIDFNSGIKIMFGEEREEYDWEDILDRTLSDEPSIKISIENYIEKNKSPDSAVKTKLINDISGWIHDMSSKISRVTVIKIINQTISDYIINHTITNRDPDYIWLLKKL